MKNVLCIIFVIIFIIFVAIFYNYIDMYIKYLGSDAPFYFVDNQIYFYKDYFENFTYTLLALVIYIFAFIKICKETIISIVR